MLVIDWQLFQKNGLPTKEKKTSITIGVFDGVHRGHQALINRIVSHNPDYIPAVVTFRDSSKEEKHALNIQTFEERIAALEKLGVEIMLVIDFTDSFRQMPGREFLELLLKHGSIGFLAVGSNFRCGHNLDTAAAAIQKFFASAAIPVEIVPEVMEGSLPISSSRIRTAIASGDLPLAEVMLGRSIS